MAIRIWLRLAEVFVPVLIALAILLAWHADRRDRAQFNAQLAAAQQVITQASASQKDRDAQLTQTLAQLTSEKQSNLSTAQLLQALPQILHLPASLTLQSSVPAQTATPNVGAGFSPSPNDAHISTSPPGTAPNPRHSASVSNLPDTPAPKSNALPLPNAVLPSSDLKPLYDFALDCQACQAKLTATQADLADEKTKSATLTKQRDAALRAAKGGSVLRRVARAAKWFALGAAAGAVAAKAAR